MCEDDPPRGNLGELFAQAEAENWCARWGCTTCGSHELRNGLERLAAYHGSVEALAVLAGREADFPWSDPHVFALRWIALRYEGDLVERLTGSPAGELYAAMLRAKQSGDRSRAEHAARNDRAFIDAERERKKSERAARHKARLEAKALRDKAWLQQHGRNGN